jgi:hypothetical protein
MAGNGQRMTWRTGRRAFAAAALAAMLLGGTLATAADRDKPIRLTIDYGDGVQKVFTGIEHREKLTVLGALEAASKHPRGIKFTHQGEEEFAFVSAIDGLENEGRAAKNWTYSVNDKKADRSCGAWELLPGDSIVWRFGQ